MERRKIFPILANGRMTTWEIHFGRSANLLKLRLKWSVLSFEYNLSRTHRTPTQNSLHTYTFSHNIIYKINKHNSSLRWKLSYSRNWTLKHEAWTNKQNTLRDHLRLEYPWKNLFLTIWITFKDANKNPLLHQLQSSKKHPHKLKDPRNTLKSTTKYWATEMVEPNSRILLDIIKDDNSKITTKFHYENLKTSFHGFYTRNWDILFVILFLIVVILLHIYRGSIKNGKFQRFYDARRY